MHRVQWIESVALMAVNVIHLIKIGVGHWLLVRATVARISHAGRASDRASALEVKYLMYLIPVGVFDVGTLSQLL